MKFDVVNFWPKTFDAVLAETGRMFASMRSISNKTVFHTYTHTQDEDSKK